MNAISPVPRIATFACEKQPATGSRGMVVTNHPLASAAGSQMLLAGGNAIDAAIAALFALTVVEPMMVGILGGGVAHIRLADGRHVVLDGLSTAPGRSGAEMYDCLSHEIGRARDVRDRLNLVGPKAVAVPGALAGWCEALSRFGTLPLHGGAGAGYPAGRARLHRQPLSVRPASATAPPISRAIRAWRRCSCRADGRSRRGRGWCKRTMREACG